MNVNLMDDIFFIFIKNVSLGSRLNLVVFIVTLSSYQKFSYLQVDGPGTVHLTGTILEVRYMNFLEKETVYTVLRIRIQDENPGSYYRVLRNNFLVLKYLIL
jgi:hypothetical protein